MAQTDTITVLTDTRANLGEFADAITEWRTNRYVEAGFYDRDVLAAVQATGLPVETNRPDDYEVVAVDGDGTILATLSLRRTADSRVAASRDANRALLGLESVHGTQFLQSLEPVSMDHCWEAGRFLRDRRRDTSRAVVAVTAATAELVARLAAAGQAALLVGEVEPSVALRHLLAFGVRVTVGPELDSPSVHGLLADRYAEKKVVPFAIHLSDIPSDARRHWRSLAARDHLLEESHAAT